MSSGIFTNLHRIIINFSGVYFLFWEHRSRVPKFRFSENRLDNLFRHLNRYLLRFRPHHPYNLCYPKQRHNIFNECKTNNDYLPSLSFLTCFKCSIAWIIVPPVFFICCLLFLFSFFLASLASSCKNIFKKCDILFVHDIYLSVQ